MEDLAAASFPSLAVAPIWARSRGASVCIITCVLAGLVLLVGDLFFL